MTPQNPISHHSFLTADQSILVSRILQELDEDKRRLYDSLTPHEKEFCLKTFIEIVKGHPEKYRTLWEIDFVRKPVSVEQFISDDEYLGVIGRGLYPCWTRELKILFSQENQITEEIVTGAIGTGKTSYSIVAMAYKIYWLTCLRDPFTYYNLAKEISSFVFGVFNATRELSYGVHVQKILDTFNSSKYFRWITRGNLEEAVKGKEKEVLKFPNNIKFAFGSRGLHALGSDMIGGLLDEMNFQQETRVSEQELKSQARDLYRQTSRRIMSRFPPLPGLGRKSPGLLFLISSRKGEDDFLDVHIRERGVNDDSMRVISLSTWEAKGHIAGMYPSGKWFRVVIGDDRYRSRILEEKDEDPEGYRVVKVPEEHRKEFEMDTDGALMDISGVAITGGGRPLIQRDRLYECIAYDKEYFPRKHPFRSDEVILGLRTKNFIEEDFLWERIVQLVDPYRNIYSPIVNPTAHRYIHLDPATSGDCAYGFAMGHVAGRTKVRRFDSLTNVEVDITAPVIYIDIVLGIRHPPGDEIDLAKVRSFIFYLKKLGFPVFAVSADQYQCFVASTKVKLLDGTSCSIKDLVDKENFWVYSCTPAGLIVPGKGHSARRTGVKAPVFKITLDDGSYEKCTAEHLWMLRDGSYQEAACLKPGDSLMPAYFCESKKFLYGYSMILVPKYENYQYVHRIVSEFAEGPLPHKWVTHHIDFCNLNNNPENLIQLTKVDHKLIHSMWGWEKAWKNPEFRAKKLLENSEGLSGFKLLWNNPAFALIVSKAATKQAKKRMKDPEFREKFLESSRQMSLKGEAGWGKAFKNEDFMKAHCERNSDLGKKRLRGFGKLWDENKDYANGVRQRMTDMNRRPESRARNAHAARLFQEFRKFCIEYPELGLTFHQYQILMCTEDEMTKSALETYRANHSVVSVEFDGFEDVYDISVDDTHNFALESGVFVHNSTDTLQQMKKNNFQAQRISMDLKPDNYSMMRTAINEGRLLIYEYEPFVEEAIWLQVDRTKKDRVFHLEGRSKDVSDAVCGVVAAIMLDEKAEQSAIYPVAPTTQESFTGVPEGSIDLEGEWLLDEVLRGIPGSEHITGIKHNR